MGRSLNGDKDDKSPEKQATNKSDADSESNLSEEEFVVEKILKMRTTKKGKVQCKRILFSKLQQTICIFYFKDLLKWKGFPDSENTWVRRKSSFFNFNLN